MGDQLDSTQTSRAKRWPAWLRTVRHLPRFVWPVLLVLVSLSLGLLLRGRFFPAPPTFSLDDVEASIGQAMAAAAPAVPYSTQVYQVILPSLVLIRTERADAAADERFGVGSGVVVNESGDILTALHVVDEATEIEVLFADGSNTAAEIVAAEPENDIALLHPHSPPGLIVPAVLGNPGAMRVGDEAFVVGNPLGLLGSMSAGVVSGLNRSIPIQDSDRRLEGLIQFDTAVNPGNSGGPLLNREGHVVGIVTALANPSGQKDFSGIGFAVPIGTAVAAAGGPGY